MASTPSRRLLSRLPPGEQATIASLDLHEETARQLMQLGLCPGENVRMVRQAPLGGPLEVEVMGFRLAIRSSDADHIVLT